MLSHRFSSKLRPGITTLLNNRRYITNYYSLFPRTLVKGPPPAGPFDIDTRELRREYLQRQQQAHPDVRHDDADSNVDSAVLGNAYRTLISPLQRAEHILALNGRDALSEGQTLTDEDLLMDVMLIREQIVEAKDDPAAMSEIARENSQRITDTEKAIAEAFTEGNLDAAVKSTIILSYWEKIQRELK